MEAYFVVMLEYYHTIGRHATFDTILFSELPAACMPL